MTPMVFLHGWGQSAQIWHGQRSAFPEARFLNLPGHGGAVDAASDDWAEAMTAHLPDRPCILIGWSLGGLLAMQIALAQPHRVAALALVSSTPCFAGRADWTHGCDSALLAGFRDGVATQSAKTLSRFFALMLHGDALPRPAYNSLARSSIDKTNPPTGTGLQQGLAMLERLDLRSRLSRIQQPALVMHGTSDAIIPVEAGRFLADQLPQGRWLEFEGCGHAPFLTRSESFNVQLEAWCQTISIPQ